MSSSSDRRPLQALGLVVLMLIGGATLVSLAGLTSRCGDGLCASDEACALDCPVLDTTPAPVLAASKSPATPPEPPPPARPTPPPPAPPTPAPTPTPPATAIDEGRCGEPAFKALAQSLVKDCERACKKDESPLVNLAPETFGALFGRPDDAGVATHFALFGCNTWAREGRTCRGFDSAIADPAACPPDSPTCPIDAAALTTELRSFLEANRDAHTILLFGTASKAGNAPSAMSDDNARLAEDRALAVAEVVHGWRRKVGARDMRVMSVVLDNTRTDYWESPAFRGVLEAQAAKMGLTRRSFSPLAADAANRSVMVVALKCPGLK